MKKHWNKIVLLAATLPLLFWGCNKETESVFEVNSDAYVIRKNIDGENKSALVFYVFANQSIASATVTPPANGGTPIVLERSEESSLTFQKEPAASDFKTETPKEGSYVFEVENTEGVKIQQTDNVEILNLGIPLITSTSFQSESFSLNVKWLEVEEADGYVVKLLNSEEKIIFLSQALSPSTEEFTVSNSAGSWAEQIYSGDSVVLQVQSFKYESDAVLFDNAYNVGEIAIAEKELVWGP